MITQEELLQKTPEEIAELFLSLQTILFEKEEKLSDKKNEIALLRHQLNVLLQAKYGRKSDKGDHSRQSQLFNEAET